MPFLNPWLLLGALGVAGAVLIHLLSRYRHRRLEWGAMELLRRAVQVRTRRMRLENILLLLLRCLIILLVALALARPTTKQLSPLGKPDAGIVVAVDGSMSMSHEYGGTSRFEKAVERTHRIFNTAQTGNPTSLMLMGAKPRVLLRNAGYQSERVDTVLKGIQPRPEVLNLEASLRRARTLLAEMTSPNKELYLVTDVQTTDWRNLSNESRRLLQTLGDKHKVFLVPIRNKDAGNVAVSGLELTSGALRHGEIVRVTAELTNGGTSARNGVRVSLEQDDRIVQRHIVNELAPGESASVPFFLQLTETGPVRLTAGIKGDGLALDNRRHAVLHIKEQVRVLVADGNPFGPADRGAAAYISRALSPPDTSSHGPLSVRTIPWLSLPSVSLRNYELVILANIPDVPAVTAKGLHRFVRQGGGLIVFVGGNVRPDVLNKRLDRNGERLLPGKLTVAKGHTMAGTRGRQLTVSKPDHPITGILPSFPNETIAGNRFFRYMGVEPAAESTVLLRLSGGAPLLLENELGRGKVLLCTTSADRSWNNMVLSPIFPALLNQATTQLLRTPYERPLEVGEHAVLPLPGLSAGEPVKMTTPEDRTRRLRAVQRDDDVVLDIKGLAAPGFYRVEPGKQSGWPLAVNPDVAESRIAHSAPAELRTSLDKLPVKVIEEDRNIAGVISQTRHGRELWQYLIAAALCALVLESLIAKRSIRHPRE